MELIFFPFERVIEINTQILTAEPDMKGGGEYSDFARRAGKNR